MNKRKPTKAQLKVGLEPGEQFTTIPYKMLRSEAWRSLSGPAVKVWLELHTRYAGGNNGKLTLAMEEGAKVLGMSKTTLHRAFHELTEKGFVKLARQGQWYGRMANEWEITTRDRNGAPASNEWRQWRRPPPPKK